MSNTRLNVSNDSISSIGTESNINNQEGGLLSFLFGSSENSKLITKALAKHNVAAAEFLIEENFEIDVHHCERTKRNAIHYMVWYSSVSKIISNRLVKLLSDGVDKEVVRCQDEDGNTPLHLAVFSKNYYIAELLEKNGAVASTRNKYGNYIAHDDNNISHNTPVPSVFMRPKQGTDTLNDKLGDIIKLFASRKPDNTESIGFNRVNVHTVDSDTEHVDNPPTDVFISNMFTRLEGGGKKNKANVSSRKISTYSNVEIISEGGRRHSSDDYESSGGYSEYARAVNNQKNDLHQETVKTIMKVLETDDEYRARSYKALLYQKIKEEDPENKLNGLERATKMLSLVNKAELKKIKKDSVDKIYDYLVTKDKERKDRENNKDSATSTDSNSGKKRKEREDDKDSATSTDSNSKKKRSVKRSEKRYKKQEVHYSSSSDDTASDDANNLSTEYGMSF
jgi:hypothetical protein